MNNGNWMTLHSVKKTLIFKWILWRNGTRYKNSVTAEGVKIFLGTRCEILYCSIHSFWVTPCLEFQRCLNLSFGVGSKIVPRGAHPRPRLQLFPCFILLISYSFLRTLLTDIEIYIYIMPLISEVSHYTKVYSAN